MKSPFLLLVGGSLATAPLLAAENDWLRTRLSSDGPDAEILHLDVDGDGRADVIERWWNGKRVRWLDENGDMNPGDVRGDQLQDVLQIDFDGDGAYDSFHDVNVKWADMDSNGVPDLQSFSLNPPRDSKQEWESGEWMIFRNFDDRGVLAWLDWSNFDWDPWGYTGASNWLPNYHGDTLFLKIHTSVRLMEDPTLNWENPFIFYDTDDDGVVEMAMRWLDKPARRTHWGLEGFFDEAYVTYDLDNDSAKDNESDFDLSLMVKGQPGLDYRSMTHDYSAMMGDPKFDPLFEDNGWRRLDTLRYMPVEGSYNAFFDHDWESVYLTFDEDDDDHRWERVEIYHPQIWTRDGLQKVDVHSVNRWGDEGGRPGLAGHQQADSLGDRGEYDEDFSGQGRLYIGAFDRKVHLYGAEWGAWTVDKDAAFHGGWEAPPPMPEAPAVEEVVQYADTDGNGFIDTIEYDYDGDRTVDLRVNLLDYATRESPAPDVAEVLDTRELGWQGLHELFNQIAEEAWVEALGVYRAAWRRGLTTPEHDLLAFASSKAERHAESYWLKEKLFRHFRTHLAQLREKTPERSKDLLQLENDLTRLYYTGDFDQYAKRIADIPAL